MPDVKRFLCCCVLDVPNHFPLAVGCMVVHRDEIVIGVMLTDCQLCMWLTRLTGRMAGIWSKKLKYRLTDISGWIYF